MLKFSSSRHHIITLAALLGMCSFSPSLWAQGNARPTTPFAERLTPIVPETAGATTAPQLYRVELPIRNVKASLMAYWLNPDGQQMPLEIKMSQSLGNEAGVFGKLPRLPGNINGVATASLPRGVTRIVAIDPQNSLIAFGTKEGLEALNTLLPTLDVPLVQYEIEAQFLQISRADLPQMGLDFGPLAKQNPNSIGSVAGIRNAEATTARLITKGRMKVLTAPRVTTIDGLNSQLLQTTTTPFVIDEGALKQAALLKPEEQSASPEQLKAVAYLSTSIGIRAAAYQNKNNLVSLSITPILQTVTVSVNATVRDGESFAIQLSPANEKQQIIVIVTTRRIRRLGDNN